MVKLFLLILSYLIGCLSGSYLLGKKVKGIDIRTQGSGNAGTTNAIRVMGLKFGVLTFFIDFLKGTLAMLIVSSIDSTFLVPAALACIIGHDFPFYMNFKGGKGVATTVGCFLVIAPKVAVIITIIWFLPIVITRIVSIGSILLFLALPPAYALMMNDSRYLWIVFIISALGLIRHKSNISRLLNGKEPKIGGKK